MELKKNRFTKISKKELDLDKIPNLDNKSSDYQEICEQFALTINAYEICGGSDTAFERRDKVFKDPLNAFLTELRFVLFVLYRQHSWNSPYPVPDEVKRVV